MATERSLSLGQQFVTSSSRMSSSFCAMLFVVVVLHTQQSSPQPSTNDFQILADRFGSLIKSVAEKHVAFCDLSIDLLFSYPNIIAINGSDQLMRIKKNLEDIFLSRVNAISSLTDMAQETFANYTYDQNIQFDYPKAKKLDDSFELVEEPFFPDDLVNLTQSTVHVPTNVYDESASVLNGVAFSEALDDVFNSNRKSFSTISWQFYCSFVGFFRIYPGISWGNSDEADQFDCRTRLWYIQAATSSKDVIILVDTSGSMTGLRIEIAKSTVIKILDTFNEDDYFNVISFSDESDYFEPCYNNSLVQATARNKQKVIDALNRGVKTRNIANYEKALTTAFEIHANAEKNSLGSKCNKVIMLITDGSPSDFREVFEKYNFPDKKVRVFTYLIGREIRDLTQLKWMACNNKGYFSHISTLADVYEHVQDYIRVLSRPLVIGRYPQKVWTNIYGNERTNELTTTVAMPVYDIKNASYNDGNLLGVIGTDMLLDVLTNVLPKHQLGVQNYPFAITNNGFIIFHPDHRPYHNGKLKPNYNNLDISEVEFIDDGKLEFDSREKFLLPIRQSMVKGETGKTRLRVKVALDEMRRVAIRDTSYYYQSVNYTPFSLGLAVPDGRAQNYMDGRHTVDTGDIDNFKNSTFTFAPWQYCTPKDSDDAKLSQFDLFLKYVKIAKQNSGSTNGSLFFRQHCFQNMCESMLYDASVTRNAINYWKGKFSSPNSKICADERRVPVPIIKNSIELIFYGTKAGLTRYLNFTDDLSEPGFIGNNTETNRMLYYIRAVENEEQLWTISVPFYNENKIFNPNKTVVTFSHPMIFIMVQKNLSAPFGAVGMQMKYSAFHQYFFMTGHNCMDGAKKVCNYSCADDQLDCYMLDEHGYVVYSEAPALHLGRFFGEIDGMVMDNLTTDELFDNSAIFRRVMVLDFQAMCQVSDDVDSSSDAPCINTYAPMTHLLNLFKWTLIKIIYFVLEFLSLCSYADLNDARSPPAEKASSDNETVNAVPVSVNWNLLKEIAGNDTSLFNEWVSNYRKLMLLGNTQAVGIWYNSILEAAETSQSKESLCIKTRYLYVAQKEAFKNLPYLNFVQSDCESCQASRYFSLNKVPNTNLFLLVVQSTCHCDNEKKLTTETKQVYGNSNGECEFHQLFRSRRKDCYSYHVDDNSKLCNGPYLRPTWNLIALLVLMCYSKPFICY